MPEKLSYPDEGLSWTSSDRYGRAAHVLLRVKERLCVAHLKQEAPDVLLAVGPANEQGALAVGHGAHVMIAHQSQVVRGTAWAALGKERTKSGGELVTPKKGKDWGACAHTQNGADCHTQ